MNSTVDLVNLRPEEKRALLERLLREKRTRFAPVSSAQKRLWFLDRIEPDTALYNVPTVLRFEGDLDIELFRRALATIVERHEALRTTFEPGEEAPRQKVNPAGPVDLPFLDLSRHDPDQRDHELQNEVDQVLRRPFNLESDLMIRGSLVRLSPREHVLIIVTHHIASDEWSLRVLLEEWSELYVSARENRVASLPVLPIQYSEFARWQEEWLRSQACAQQIGYWKKQLAGAKALQIFGNRSPKNNRALNGKTATAVYGPDLLGPLKALAQESEATLFMTLLAAFKTVLYRYSQQEDLVVGCPIAGRTRADVEPLIGFFVNTLAIRTQVNGAASFRQLLKQVREHTLAAYANQEVPFDRVIEEVHPERSASRTPLVQVMFALNNDFVGEDLFPGLRVTEMQAATGTAKFDLTFVARQTLSGLAVAAEYDSELFTESSIQRFLGHFEEMLRGIIANPDQEIARLPLITVKERRYLIEKLNETSRPFPNSQTVHQVFEARVVKAPDATAISYGPENLSYRELNVRANQLAHYLAAHHVGAGSLVGVFLDRSVDMIVAFLGILKAGAAYVPLDLSYPAERLAFMIADSRIALVLTHSSCAPQLPATGLPVVCLDLARSRIEQEPRNLPLSSANAESLAYVIYTSGSTGQPKGVPVAHRGITRLVCGTDYIEITPEDRIAQASNASFDAATFEIWGALLNGSRLVGISKETAVSPEDFVRTLRDEEISILFLTTALFNQLAREEPGAFRTLKTVLFGGEAVDPKWVRAVLSCDPPDRLLHVYGPTENTTFSSWHEVREVGENDLTVPIGRPIANSELYILDALRQPVPIGLSGEIYVGGDGLAHGYWQRPELTEARFVPHPFNGSGVAQLYRTGDLARFNENGEVEFVGRVDHQVKLRGFRIELGEIEALLAKHAKVANNVVLLREDTPGEKRLAAYIIPREKSLGAADLRTFLRGQLPDYMIPADFVFLDAFPLTPNEKIDRRALPVPEQKRADVSRTFLPPRDDLEQQLAKVWETVLGVQPVGVADNFFELGGHSMMAVRLFAQIEKQLGRKLPLATLFRAPTIEQLARLMREESEANSWSTIVDIQPNGSKPPFFWMHTLGGDGGGGFFYYRKLAELLGPDQPSFGVRSPREPFTRIEDMARFYVDEIRKFQPEGPYYLGGFCFGGNVAYEMARVLHEMGERVGLLVMLESSPPNVDQRQSWSATAAKYSLENLVENVKEFVSHSPEEQLAVLKKKSRRLKEKLKSRVSPPEENASKPIELKDVIDLANYPEGYVRYAETHWQALTAYHPRPYPGEVILFRAKKQGLTQFSHTLGWDALVGDRVQVNVIPGTHESMLQEPNVQIVANRLTDLLRAASARSPQELAAA